jgi:hypothetical protein
MLEVRLLHFLFMYDDSAARLVSTYSSPVFVSRITHHLRASSSMSFRDQDGTSSQAMQICTVSARVMIGEEKSKTEERLFET